MPDSKVALLRRSCENLLAQLTEEPGSAGPLPETARQQLRTTHVYGPLPEEVMAYAQQLGERHAATGGAVPELIGELLKLFPAAEHSLARQTEILSAAVQAYLASVTEKLAEQAQRDALTGLLNRGAFEQRFRSELTRAHRYQRELALVLFDLNRFKQVNDRFGHPVGDQVLQWFARLLQTSLRQSDSAFRYGGDEFAALLPETSKEAAWKVLERLDNAVRAAHQLSGEVVAAEVVVSELALAGEPVSISYGLAAYPQDASSLLDLLKLADARLYEGKRARRRQRSPFTPLELVTEHPQ